MSARLRATDCCYYYSGKERRKTKSPLPVAVECSYCPKMMQYAMQYTTYDIHAASSDA